MSALSTPAPISLMASAATHVCVEFAIRSDLRYISHQDEIRMLWRALVRADWPIAFSAGFNPRPHINLPLPRSVGMASESELAIVELCEERDAQALFESLAPRMPEDAPLLGVRSGFAAKTAKALRARYEIELANEHQRIVVGKIDEIMRATTLLVSRRANPADPTRTVDIRPFIESLQLDGAHLRLSLACDGQRTARPSEIFMLLDLPVDRYAHHVRRVEVEWNQELRGRTECRRSQERMSFGYQESLNQDHGAAPWNEG